MSTNHNRIKVADLEINQPNKILKTNENGELEFSNITENSAPVSATAKGIVDNTSLQELGGVDKSINGVRVGRGPGNIVTNTAVGYIAMNSNTTGTYNTALGGNALNLNTTSSFNTAIGVNALAKTTGQRNTAVGYSALYNNATGSFNTAIGAGAGGAGSGISTGSSNILVGHQAGRAITTGSNNLLIENTINDGITTGNRNIILNPLSGGVTGITTGDNNTIIGGIIGTPNVSNNITIATGGGLIGFKSDTSGLTTIPRQTNALITADTTGKAVITKEYLASSLPSMITINTAPTSSTAIGIKGEIRIDADYIYICVNTNTWKRSPLTSW